MEKINRDIIKQISQHSNLTDTEICQLLQANCYPEKASWEKFIRLFLLALGIGFFVSGVVFFFAYNWELLPKFVKLSIVLTLLIASLVLVFLPKASLLVKKSSLTASSVLIGVLFAVYGQIYQTGADAYDFFLAWSVFCTLFVVVANFAPLWMLYLVLINTTFILYMEQAAADSPKFLVLFVLLNIQFLALLLATHFTKNKPILWFLYSVAIATIGLATIGNVFAISDEYEAYMPLFIASSLVVYATVGWQGWRNRNGFYLTLIALSCIAMIATFMVKTMDNDRLFLALAVFLVLSVTATIMGLITLKKIWKNEN